MDVARATEVRLEMASMAGMVYMFVDNFMVTGVDGVDGCQTDGEDEGRDVKFGLA